MRWSVSGLLPVLGIAVVVVSAPVVGIFVLDAFLDSPRKIGLAAGVLQGYVTVVAIIAGGAFAIYRFRIFRTLEPHVTVSLDVSHRVISESYVHVFITAVLHNGSRVEVGIREATFGLQMISPMMDFTVEIFSAEASQGEDTSYIQWPTLREVTRTWDDNEFVIEPGSSHYESIEFMVSREVRAVLVDTYFYNQKYRRLSTSPQGWGVTTAYDIIRVR